MFVENPGLRHFGFVLAMIVMVASPSYPQSGTIKTKILAYNLHHGEGTDGRLDLVRIAEIIKSINPDFAGLQEVDSMTARTGKVDQAAEYARLTGMKWVFGKAIPFDGGSYGNTALSRLPIKKSVRLALPGGEPRMALFTDIDLSDGANPSAATVTFITTHLMVDDADAQLESARRINAFAQDARNGDPNRPMVLLGDMNAERGSVAIGEFLKTWKADGFDYGIDWVFYRPAGRWNFLKAGKILDGNAAIASDHEPVTQEMELSLPSVSLRPRSPAHYTGSMTNANLDAGAFPMAWRVFGISSDGAAMDLAGRRVHGHRPQGAAAGRLAIVGLGNHAPQ